jgi:lysozyme family protein
MFSPEFIQSFNHIMLAEVGNWFNPNLPSTQLGCCSKAEMLGCGYGNDPCDTGGETKFGIAKSSNPDVDVKNLTMAQAQNIYYDRYWLAAKCDKIGAPMSLLHFDTAVNMGVGTAAKFLQSALGVSADGAIGPGTLAAYSACKDIPALCTKYLNLRQAHYDAIIARNPSQAKFAKGWKSRNDAMRAFLNVK